jgi:4-amino-4-deoxy-L-arabinose transferase-like glycosyltransferase
MDKSPSVSSPLGPSSAPFAQWKARWGALALALIALSLRLWGLTWSLPSAQHFYSYHPDEILVLSASHAADLWRGQFNPHFYNYGSLPIYLISFFRPAAYALLGPSLYTDYLLGRLITALMGAATVSLVFLIAREAAGETAGWIAGVCMAIAPEHVIHSHYVTVDVPATFWIALSLYCCLKSLRTDQLQWPILAGIAAGCAAGSKYNAGAALLSVLLATYRRPRVLWKSLLAFVAAFLLCVPGMLLWTSEFLRDFDYELRHTRTGHGLVFVDTAPGWIYHWTFNLRWGLGYALLALASVGLVAALVRMIRKPGDPSIGETENGTRPLDLRLVYGILLAFLVPYYLVIGAAQVKFLRYTIPMLPPLFVLLGAEAARLWEASSARRPSAEGAAPRSGALSFILVAVGALAALYTLAYTAGFDGLLSRTPPQDQALGWLQNHARGQSLGLTTVPWFYSPPVSPYNGGPQSQRAFYERIGESPYVLSVVGTDADRLNAVKPRYVPLSEYETMDSLRLMDSPAGRRLPEVAQFARFWDALRRDYVPVFSTESRPGLPSGWAPSGEPPHDWLYPYPAITIWERKNR